MIGLINRGDTRITRSEVGQGLAEYSLLIGLVAIAVVAALVLLAPQIGNAFNTTSNSL